jgi:hypothetical protein
VTSVVFHLLAERELIESTRFYEARASGLGGDFIQQVERTLAQIVANPEAGARLRERSGAGSSSASLLRFCISSVRRTCR